MPSDSGAVRRWAAAQAGSVPSSVRGAPTADRQPPPTPTEATLVSVTEVRSVSGGFHSAWGYRPDGRPLLATGSYDNTTQIWDPKTGESLRTLTGHADSVWTVAWGYRPDGRPLLATGSYDNTARIWDPDTGEPLATLTGHAGQIIAIAWGCQPDGRPLLATAGHDNTARIWDPDTGELLRTLIGHTSAIYSVAWGQRPDGRPILATAGWQDNTVRIWDPDTGELLSMLTTHTRYVISVSWTNGPDGQPRLATAANGVSIWSGDGIEFRGQVLIPEASNALSVSWAPLMDGRAILAANSQSDLYLWDGTTSRLLHEEAHSFNGTGGDHLSWAVDPSGSLLLAAPTTDRRVHIWEVVLDPPATSPAGISAASRPGRDRARPPIAEPTPILDPPADVTPDFSPATDRYRGGISGVACSRDADGRLLAAAMPDTFGSQLEIWNLSAGALLRTLTHPELVRCASWGRGADGRPLLATGSLGGIARVWDPHTGELVRALSGHGQAVWCTAWGYRTGGRPLLAVGGTDGIARIWDPDTGELLRTLAGHVGDVAAAAWGYGPDGQPLLATGAEDGTAWIWDPAADQPRHRLTAHGPTPHALARTVHSVAWGYGADRQPLLATGCQDGSALIWDPGTGQLLHELEKEDWPIFALSWAQRPDGRPLLAVGGRSTRVWDPETGTRVASVPGPSDRRQSLELTSDPAGDLLLVVAGQDGADGPARVWRITAGGPAAGRGEAGRDGDAAARRAAGLTRELLRLGRSGLWPPLGLLADLVELTGPEAPGPDRTVSEAGHADEADESGRPRPAALCDARLGVLAGEPGVARLRAVGWEPAARVSMAALVASALAIPEQFRPPDDVPAETLLAALTRALAEQAGPTWRASAGDLRAAAARITDRTITLLRILGPAACAADPLLPLRFAHRLSELPALTPRELRLLAAAGPGRPGLERNTTTGTLRYSPGTAGLARTGPLNRLLPTQLALPRDLLTIRLATDELLYRQHRAPAPPAPDPVTIILDTTPPTYGPAGTTLRLAAHLLTLALWEHDRYPSLITLADPGTVNELRAPADLLAIWAGVTLEDAAPALATALTTAGSAGQPTVFASHVQTARDCGYRLSPAARLLTAHHPPERPPLPPASPWHAHLPPGPTRAQLATAIGQLVFPSCA